MKILTTGLIKNPLFNGKRVNQTLVIRYQNKGTIPATVQIKGFYLEGTTNIEYVADSVSIEPSSAKDTKHYILFEAFEFFLTANSKEVEIKAWGTNAIGNMTEIYHLQVVGRDFFGSSKEQKQPYLENKNFVINQENNILMVIDQRTQEVIKTIPVGHKPHGLGVNPHTGRIYVSNKGSNNVTVIDGKSLSVIATVLVGYSPGAVRVDGEKNKIHITNEGSGTISVIDGTTHTVVATKRI
ncbi:MAG: YncE family protein [Desulfitobacterium sp.]|nr:YncE family protein [Desulfitobacterium sp.]